VTEISHFYQYMTFMEMNFSYFRNNIAGSQPSKVELSEYGLCVDED